MHINKKKNMKVLLKKVITTTILATSFLFINAQSNNHPIILITEDERADIIEKIEQYDWAQKIVEQLHNQVDHNLEKHRRNPNAILKTIPRFAKNDQNDENAETSDLTDKHNRVLTLASHSAFLYYLTKKEDYARFAADILAVYIDTIAPKTPQTTTICGNAFYDPRTTYGPFALTYDFIYPYIKSTNATVYNQKIGKRIPFDNNKAQKAIHNMVGNTLKEYAKPDEHGKFVSNHPILTAPGVLFGILCIEDDAERERLFNVFWEQGTAHQNSFANTIIPMFGEQGIWPESTSYSFMPIVTMIINIVDRIYPNMNITQNYFHIFEGNFLFDNLKMPDGRFVRYGDSKRNHDQTNTLYRYTLNIAERKGFELLKQKALVALRQSYDEDGGYNPKISSGGFNNYSILQLLWGTDVPKKVEGKIDFQKPTVIVKHAGIALQRNYVKENNGLYGLCGIIGGAHYVHSHVTGISMELYGAGYVMAPNAGLPPTVLERRIPLHEKYFRLHAGNNTVIVNGTSHGRDEGSWKSNACVWQNTTVNIAAEPKHLEDPISDQFSFATQFLNDKVNNCHQQRTLSTIRTSENTAYYLDIFRSKSLEENKFHDYIYHNIGDKTLLTLTNGPELQLSPTNRYKTDIGDIVQSPGWRFFEKTMLSEATSQAIKIRFDIEFNERYMHMFIPHGVEREYTKALAPPTREALNGYEDKKTQLIAIRQKGEAWDQPFITVLEPSINKASSIQSVENLRKGKTVIGIKVISKINNTVITDYIISMDEADQKYINTELKLEFEGRFGIVRIEENAEKKILTLYIGDGKKLTFENEELETQYEGKGVQTFAIQ